MKLRLMIATTSLLAVGCGGGHQQAGLKGRPGGYSIQTCSTQNYSQVYGTPRQEVYVAPRAQQVYGIPRPQAEVCLDFTGPRGPDGPVGEVGEQGPTGQTGPAGYAMAGPRGADGPIGAMGEQGRIGAPGPTGDMVVGPAGVAGPAGNRGDQGLAGQTGIQGASAAGFAGAIGPAGRAGAQGPTGLAGVKGLTTVGPAGPAGRAGPTGARGVTGQTGAQGVTTAGIAGAVGAAGAAGPQGSVGATGNQGPAGKVDCWTTYRDFWFDSNSSVLSESDTDKVAKIAIYMRDNPSIQLGIDASTNPRATEARDVDLSNRRVKAVRDMLIQAGVPAERISDGQFGAVELRRDRRVEVLFRTR